MAKLDNPIVAPATPKADVVNNEGYIYEGEKNYEAPKPDPWVSEAKESK